MHAFTCEDLPFPCHIVSISILRFRFTFDVLGTERGPTDRVLFMHIRTCLPVVCVQMPVDQAECFGGLSGCATSCMRLTVAQ